MAGLNYLVNRTECLGRINLGKGVYDLAHKFIVSEAQQVYRALIGNLFGVATSYQLVKQGQGVSNTAAGRSNHKRHHTSLSTEAFGFQNGS